ncbi:MAG: phosphoglycerate dehydrogenase, partial [Clostridia bacterium]|nr:phosphoglycerate dehydrogenase [Clostridia bacterium]
DPFISEAVAAELGVKLGTLEEILPKADLITVHMPKTKATYHMINKDTIALMKDGVYILNCARGGIIEENDLYQAMVDGKVAGAALDVFEEEPNETSPLLDLPGFIATPHLGASTKEAQLNVAVDVSAEIVNALTGKMVKNTVNIPSINPQTMSFVKPFLGLAEKLGSIQSQIIDGRAQKIEITYSGDLAKNNVKPMTTSLIKGFLEPVLKESVNFINAPHLAAERGIQIVEIKDAESTGYSNLISVKVSTENSTKSLAGTLFGKNEERLVMIDGYRIDAVPSPHMVYIPHMDKPRIIGPVGNLIGAHNINIAGMLVGRKELGGQAVMILSVDDLVPESTLDEIGKIDGILEVKMINL